MLIRQNFLNFFADKEVTFYQFDKVKETYIDKQNNVKEYSRTKRVDKKLPIQLIAKMTVEQGINYLKHRTYVENDKQVWPVLREKYAHCKYIHLDFSENINITPKFEVQDAHFSGKQYSLHCMLLEPANPYKFVFHLSNNTTHDSAFVDLVLNDIFDLQNVWNETVLIKSDNCQEHISVLCFWFISTTC